MISVRQWSGRERIRAAFEFEKPDRLPRFDQTISMEVASEIMGREMLVGGGTLRYREVKARFESEQAGGEFVEKMKEDVAEFYAQLGYDMVRLPWRDSRKASAKLDEFTYLFGDRNSEGPWEIYHYDEATRNWHLAESWLSGGRLEKLLAWLAREREDYEGPDKDPTRMDDHASLREKVGPDVAMAATVGFIGVPMWEEAWLMALAVDPELVGFALDCQVDQALADIPLAVETGVDVAFSGGDFCTKTGPVYSPATFDSLTLPRLKKITEVCALHGLYYVFRTDGNTWPVADSLFTESGIHGYGEIDYGVGMRLGELRESYSALTLFGNLDCGGDLIFGEPEDVRRLVRKMVSETGGVGHVVGSSNAIMPETPAENYMAMLDEAAKYSLA